MGSDPRTPHGQSPSRRCHPGSPPHQQPPPGFRPGMWQNHDDMALSMMIQSDDMALSITINHIIQQNHDDTIWCNMVRPSMSQYLHTTGNPNRSTEQVGSTVPNPSGGFRNVHVQTITTGPVLLPLYWVKNMKGTDMKIALIKDQHNATTLMCPTQSKHQYSCVRVPVVFPKRHNDCPARSVTNWSYQWTSFDKIGQHDKQEWFCKLFANRNVHSTHCRSP